MSTVDDHQHLLALLEAALRVPANERRDFLLSRFPNQPSVVDELVALLATRDATADFEFEVEGLESWSETLERLARHRPTEPRYRVVNELARGGQGVVYRVWDEDLRRSLAMKVTVGQTTDDPTSATPRLDSKTLGRFLEEAQITGQLDHPGIVPVHELGIDAEGRVFFTMRLVRGAELGAIIELARREEEGWSQARVLNVLLRVCESMAYAHEHGAIHRDLKPSNIMVGRHGEVYVMDWGLGRLVEHDDLKDIRIAEPPTSMHLSTERDSTCIDDPELRTQDGDVFGTPAYMPPEQARGELQRVGKSADVYSIGAILYHLLAGHPPYYTRDDKSPNVYAILDAVRAGPPKPLRSIAHEAPDELISICERAMQRDPENRFADMDALREDLSAYLENRVVKSHRTGPLVELKKWVQRNRLVASALAALALGLTTAGFTVGATENSKRRVAERAHDESSARSLLAQVDTLWPVHPDRVPALETWLGEARRLTAKLDDYEQLFESAKADGFEPDGSTAMTSAAARTAEQRLQVRSDFAARLPGIVERDRNLLREAQAAEPPDPDNAARLARDVAIREREAEIAKLDAERAAAQLELESALSAASRAPESEPLQLAALIATIQFIDRESGGIEERLDLSRSLPERSVEAEHAEEWARAIATIADVERSPRYGGLQLTPQLGLVPLRQDPESGLYEFLHVLSGVRPRLGADDRWEIEPETGIVLVLLPGGDVQVGAQELDPDAPGYLDVSQYEYIDTLHMSERAVHQQSLEPYFLSKYEMTQAQWWRLTGDSPSIHFAGYYPKGGATISRSHPVDHVSFEDCDKALPRWGLSIPTEAQWAIAAKAGSPGPYWTNEDFKSIIAFVNFADNSIERHSFKRSIAIDFNDEYSAHAPVDAFDANPNGLHSIVGNVHEWCRDWAQNAYQHTMVIDASTGELGASFGHKKPSRGGSFRSDPALLRLSHRALFAPAARLEDLGIRPSRSVDA